MIASTSDSRLKSNRETFSRSSTDILMELDPVTYTYTNNKQQTT
ncbi:MAG: tail fiber domain-containing protein, partial [Spongiibacteraceae bacterium]|nr:tail fiber domain-containing protein [Spongiibacteraceae bacterium]